MNLICLRCHARLFALAFLVFASCAANDPAWKAALTAVNALRDVRAVTCSEPVGEALRAVERTLPTPPDAGVVTKDVSPPQPEDGGELAVTPAPDAGTATP